VDDRQSVSSSYAKVGSASGSYAYGVAAGRESRADLRRVRFSWGAD
jgi:hypothetical protein